MNSSDVEILKLDEERLSLKKNLSKTLQALERNECLLLKDATDVTNIKHVLSSDMSFSEAVKKKIILNEIKLSRCFVRAMTNNVKFVKTILFSTRNNDFHIAVYETYTTDVQNEEMIERDSEWKEMTTTIELVETSCAHLWEDRDVSWIIKVDKGFREETIRDMITMKTNEDDMYVLWVSAV